MKSNKKDTQSERVIRQFIEQQSIEPQFIERQFIETSGVAKGGKGERSAPGGTFMGAALWAML